MFKEVSKFSFFSGLNKDQLQIITQVLIEEKYDSGELIIKQGEDASAMYFIVAGQVTVYKNNNFIAKLNKGDFFGEMALITSEKRNSNVVVSSDQCIVLKLSKHRFEMIRKNIGSAASKEILRRIQDNFKRSTKNN